MDISELDFDLPERLIAQEPAQRRDAARLLIVDRASGSLTDTTFAHLPEWIDAGDCLVLNDTQVIRARIHARKSTGGAVEILLLREIGDGTWRALLRPGAKVKPGTKLHLSEGVSATAGEILADGQRAIRFNRPDVLAVLERIGEVPLPPYIRREQPAPSDANRYQTVYAAYPGAVAAPTAGLHYTPELLANLRDRGAIIRHLTLHVGYGTFKPVTATDLADHRVDAEEFSIPEITAKAVNRARRSGKRVVAVGTTTTRVLESQLQDGELTAGAGETDLCIVPGHSFRAVDALQTNFHLPRSSLLALVAAFAGGDLILEAYRYAIAREFRFYSYGDTMLII